MASFNAGETIRLTAEKLVAGGEAIARVDGFPVFVGGMYPGDEAVVLLTEVRKGFARGVVESIEVHSPLRREDPCPIASSCGGCDWTSLRLDAQLVAKREILLDSLKRIGKFPLESLPQVAIHPSPLNYRLRSRLHQSDEGLGFFAAKSHEVIPLVPECEVVGPQLLDHLPHLGGITAPGSSIRTFESEARGLVVDSVDVEPTEVSIEVAGFRYRLTTESFFQVNRHLLPLLMDLVLRSADHVKEKGVALDLYGGVGFFALPMATRFRQVITIESDAESHRWAKVNARGTANVTAKRADVENWLRREARPASFIFVDPPRAGLAAGVIDAIADKAVERICHLSCDPVTFARDASRLTHRGWTLVSLDLVDLFPNTHHVETLSSFERER